MTRQAMSGLIFIHDEGLVYRELCAENCLLFSSASGSASDASSSLDALRLKLTDFRLTRKAGSRVTLEQEHLTPYHPPELCDLLQKEA